jgi:general secretion pathway protein B
MSYILQALKKSQQDRELGQVPTLATTPDSPGPIPPRSINPWTFGALILALTAVLIALYGTFGERLQHTEDQMPPLPRSALGPAPDEDSGQILPDTGAGGTGAASNAAATIPPRTADRRPGTRIGSTGERPVDLSVGRGGGDGLLSDHPGGEVAKPKEPDRRGGPNTPTPGRVAQAEAENTTPAVGTKKAVQPGADALVATTRHPFPTETPGSRLPDPVGRPGYSEFLRSEAERLRKRLVALDTAPAPTPARDKDRQMPDETVVAPELPVRARKLPGTLPPGPATPSTRGLALSKTAAGRPRPPLERELPLEIHGALPRRQIIAHIYAKEPERRFIIVNSVKLHEGEGTADGLILQEVRPDGIVFQFKNHRFFQPR